MPPRYTRVPFQPSRFIGWHEVMNRYPEVIVGYKQCPKVGPTAPITAPALRTVYPGMPWLPVGN